VGPALAAGLAAGLALPAGLAEGAIRTGACDAQLALGCP
jgi:hypothetical protein